MSEARFEDGTGSIKLVWFHQPYYLAGGFLTEIVNATVAAGQFTSEEKIRIVLEGSGGK